MNELSLLRMGDVTAYYDAPSGGDVAILDGVDFSLKMGGKCVLMGPSGCGKTTFLHVLGGLLKPKKGRVFWGVTCVSEMKKGVEKLRGEWLGFVLQKHTLLPELTALENVIFPWRVVGDPKKNANERALELLDAVGLTSRRNALPYELSGGEQQRVAIARALMVRPKFLLADEPTGSLDVVASEVVGKLLFQLCEEHGTGLLVATHNRQLAERADRLLKLENGRIIDGENFKK